ncbi:variable large family protein [Borreliella burgdorferi]|uniref:variable large family protein n=1 Tax=Borreliella burgdorferi TaxID=139 RepID=UPI003AA80EC9
MRKISSAILLSAFLVFISCKNNVGEAETKDDKKDSVSMFYQSLVRLGNGFIDVFNAFSGLVADAFFTADPKKSEVKTYFDSISKKLKSTKEKLESLSNKKENSNADSADAGSADAGAKDGKKGDAVTSVVQEVNKWLEEMMKAAEKAAAAGDAGKSKIGDVASAGGGAGGNDASVKGIALGIKGIVDAAGKASGEKGGGALKGVKEAAGNSNADAGKLFATRAGGRRAGAADVGKASDAVSAVSGKQIIKAIVDAAGKGDGEKGGGALKGVEEAADKNNGDAGKLFDTNGGGQQAGAADVGKASDAVSAVSGKQIIKAIVDAAGKASGEKGGGALKGVEEAAGKNNGDAGKLFDTQGGGGRRADAEAVGKASDAVSAVSGKQIIKAIVDAAGKGDGDHAGAAAGAATNPIAAAIGEANQAGAAFVNNNMKKDDKIAAAIVLRGLAKGGKFAADSADAAKSAKSVIESARKLTNG